MATEPLKTPKIENEAVMIDNATMLAVAFMGALRELLDGKASIAVTTVSDGDSRNVTKTYKFVRAP